MTIFPLPVLLNLLPKRFQWTVHNVIAHPCRRSSSRSVSTGGPRRSMTGRSRRAPEGPCNGGLMMV
jgi:hypothetical protein